MNQPPILIIDNYDSFTYILAHYLAFAKKGPVLVVKNDEIDPAMVKKLKPNFLVISPGPGNPENSGDLGNMAEIFAYCMGRMPILGVCLGHQFIAHFFGGRIVKAKEVVHGKTSPVNNFGGKIFAGLPDKFNVMRYHSLMVEKANFPAVLKITAETDDGIIMALEHEKLPIFGVQFHPESFASQFGEKIITNFLKKR